MIKYMKKIKDIWYYLLLIPLLFYPSSVFGQESELVNFQVLGSTSIMELIIKVVNAIVRVTLPIAGLFIVYSGFLFLTASGDEGKLTTAKKTFGWAIVGLAILLGAKLIINIIAGTFDVQGI